MSAIFHDDVQQVEFPEVQGWEKKLYDFQIPIALIALAALFFFR
ncbi:hypothetical protein MMIC_P1727 [Mariprofundus micogutta]|uniref:Uncharacterized protein n=1 Tax=Mariprofundus micogutta TaxID=1921010 RepID=A0A1L8CPE0_9PROT|nr:hypothetical protein [Mariprofundus micogutta]GAV20754.1 hypothetical protein MMIC_P1727 [Mariprofundus micogutta]